MLLLFVVVVATTETLVFFYFMRPFYLLATAFVVALSLTMCNIFGAENNGPLMHPHTHAHTTKCRVLYEYART